MSEMRTQVLLSRHLYVVLSLPRRASSTAFIPAAQNLRAQLTLLRSNLPPPLPVLKQPALPTDRPTDRRSGVSAAAALQPARQGEAVGAGRGRYR